MYLYVEQKFLFASTPPPTPTPNSRWRGGGNVLHPQFTQVGGQNDPLILLLVLQLI
jgi:hypothetical protein